MSAVVERKSHVQHYVHAPNCCHSLSLGGVVVSLKRWDGLIFNFVD